MLVAECHPRGSLRPAARAHRARRVAATASAATRQAQEAATVATRDLFARSQHCAPCVIGAKERLNATTQQVCTTSQAGPYRCSAWCHGITKSAVIDAHQANCVAVCFHQGRAPQAQSAQRQEAASSEQEASTRRLRRCCGWCCVSPSCKHS